MLCSLANWFIISFINLDIFVMIVLFLQQRKFLEFNYVWSGVVIRFQKFFPFIFKVGTLKEIVKIIPEVVLNYTE